MWKNKVFVAVVLKAGGLKAKYRIGGMPTYGKSKTVYK